MGRGELVLLLGNTGHFIQVVHQSANGWGRDCVAVNRMNKSTVTQMKLCNWIQGRVLHSPDTAQLQPPTPCCATCFQSIGGCRLISL